MARPGPDRSSRDWWGSRGLDVEGNGAERCGVAVKDRTAMDRNEVAALDRSGLARRREVGQ